MKFILIYCAIVLLMSVGVTSSLGRSGAWKEVGISLYRTVGSATFAADTIGVKYLHMLKAFQWAKPERDEYLVYFRAKCVDGRVKTCEAIVEWTFFGEVLKSSSCWVEDFNKVMY